MSDTPTFLSKAKILSLIAQAKADVKTEILSALTNSEATPVFDDDTLTVYFWNGQLVGVGAGLLEDADFMQYNAATPQLFSDFFEDDEFSIIEEDYRDKAGNVVTDGNGNNIKQYKTKFYSHPFLHGKGTTAGGDEYEYFSIGKHGAQIAGYETHFAFSSPVAGHEDEYKEYILLDTYQSSKIVDGNGVTHIGSFRGGYPIAEIGVPETYVHPYRGYKEQGLRMEMQWLDILTAVCLGRRGEGWYGSASEELSNHFCGDAKDIDGTSITAANEAGNSFSVANTNAYAGLAVGAQVSFDSVTNEYGARDGTTVITRTITAKSVGESSTTFTFDGDAVNVYGRKLHTSYMAATGATDGLTGICAYSTLCPIGRQPFKLFNVEKPWGAHATWLDWVKAQSSGYLHFCQTTDATSVDSYGWNGFYFPGWSTSGNYVRTMKSYHVPRIVLPNVTYSGDSVTYYAVRQYWQFDGKCVLYGRAYQSANYKYGGQFYLASCSYSGCSVVADINLYRGCWGRSFRSVR